MSRSKLLPCAIAVASSLTAAAVAGAGQAGPKVVRAVDTGLCPFPLGVTASKAGQGDAVGTTALKFSFPGPTAFRLRNGSTGRTVTLRSTGSTPVDTTTGSVAFSGHVLWAWAAGSQVPFLATDGRGKLRAPFYVLSGPARPTVIDPCALVAPSPPSVRPAATKAPWALPAYALSHMAFARLTPLVGFLIRHDHAHLDLIVNGRKATVPAGVGLAEPVDKGPCPKPTAPTGDCKTGHVFVAQVANSPLHTHTSSGIIHIEPDRPGTYTLGQFFDEWGVRLDARCLGGYCTGGGRQLRAYVDGKRVANPRAIVLTNKQEIALVFGGAGDFASVPTKYTGGWPGVGCGGPGEHSCLP